ncbi:type II 3-dehydroquinate dehydratase [Dactylosporangium sp. AC04546]|uniref:type II 3-dehydroquinate dehydratase n=1 Tax=unclassified Dactylosporangium TaxID=2621675 RepID=UPI001EDE8E08|nr:type II 3-dehydroquinate dehydratase [Dactylosporangium sp. AC04546]WVK79154.1 type II 3-dehydroquinate dehydratase [Dactylosporangium sp. AC04546]
MPPRHQLLLLNGPNLNLLGVREPERYGTTTLGEIEDLVAKAAAEHGIGVQAVQSNHEGVLIDTLHAARTTCAGVIVNPGGLAHTSVSLRDAVAAVALPTVEVHLTNIHRREEFRHHSYISGVADAVIAGAGPIGYVLAVTYLVQRLA